VEFNSSRMRHATFKRTTWQPEMVTRGGRTVTPGAAGGSLPPGPGRGRPALACALTTNVHAKLRELENR
jgi:hypothetical protein